MKILLHEYKFQPYVIETEHNTPFDAWESLTGKEKRIAEAIFWPDGLMAWHCSPQEKEMVEKSHDKFLIYDEETRKRNS